MGFWSGLGNVLKKAAPIAAAFIPGVGPIASSLIGAGLGAATSKGGLKERLIGAGIGAIPTKGLGPSAKGVPGLAKSTINTSAITDVAKKGFASKLGDIAKQAGKNILTGGGSEADRYRTPPFVPQGGGTDWKGMIGGAVERHAPSIIGAITNRGGGPSVQPPSVSQAVPRGGNLMRGLGPTMGRRDQSNPNLAESIGAGRIEAIRNQPFRRGYEVNYLGSDDETPFVTRMPPIRTGEGRRRQAAR